MECVYIVAIPERGGAWVDSGKAFKSREQAEKQLERDRKDHINYTRIFTLEIQETEKG